jgi:tRNA-uridine 2-sulfurtransferase
MKIKPKKVFVGISGGVDSAVSAALLKKEGYDVTGVFIKAWTPEGYPCNWKEDRRSAMRVAAVLDIPFITLDLEKEYKKEVVDYMIAEYKKGRTPNPDVMCNKEIKFGHFLKFALKNGADFVATGHYARAFPSPDQGEGHAKRGVGLIESTDKNKDQSYFLWTLTQNQLKHILFPIGHLQKSEVRKLAAKFGLPQATRKDSQGLCFLGKVDMKEFLSRYIPQKRGDVLKALSLLERGLGGEAEVIGHHQGALFFTIGERHGFIITQKTEKEVPLYVVAKNISKNTITVAPKAPSLLGRGGGEAILKDVNLIGKIPNKKLLCRIRYRQEKVGCKVEIKKDEIKIIFDKPQMGVSPGQSLVLYDGEVCLGGGIISQ